MLSNKYNIVVCTSFFKQKKMFFCEFSLFTFFEIAPVRRGGLGFNLFFLRYKRSLFGMYRIFCSLPTLGGQLHAPEL